MKKTFTFLSLFFAMSSFAGTINGYRLIKEEALKEFDSTVKTFEHIKTGAKIIYISNSDDEKAFAITFKTHPTDDTGLPHILEHSVLCGSKKFPLKDPFVQLMKSSLKTFLNASTYPDKTMYPVASRNNKDFMNLMDVYMDAVFFPRIYQTDEILKQEGWHYEYDQDQKRLSVSGVVYGEMKGANSNPERRLYRLWMKHLYPNTTYTYDSGGFPPNIPDLTQKAFLDFHKKNYHPSNSIIFFYGNGDVKKHLAFIDKNYLSQFSKTTPVAKLEAVPEVKNQVAEDFYPSAESEKEASYLSMSYSFGNNRDPKLLLAFEILSYYLGQSEAAPLKQIILDKKLAKNLNIELERDLAWPYLSIYAQNADATKRDEFFKVITETLKEYTNKGLDHELLMAALKKKEFELREFNSSSPIGVTMNTLVMRTALYGDDPLSGVRFDKLFTELKNDLKKGYFEKIINDYILNNAHNLKLTLRPDKNLAAQEEKDYQDAMAKHLKKLSEKELLQIKESAATLKKNQDIPDSKEALDTIPTLSLKDLDKKIEKLPLEEKITKEGTFLTHALPTKGIAYLSFYFDAQSVPQELIPYLPLFNRVLGSLDTEKHSYQELSKLLDLETGGLSFDIFAESRFEDPNIFSPRIVVNTKAFYSNFPKALDLIEEILLSTKFDNKKRIQELVELEKSNWDGALSTNGLDLARLRVGAHLSRSGVYREMTSGASYFLFLKDLEKNFDKQYDDFIVKMKELQKIVFNKKNLVISLASDKKELANLKQKTLKLVSHLKEEKLTIQNYKLTLLKGHEAILLPGQVQYVVKGGKLSEYKGDLKFIAKDLGTNYLWNKVRVQNGAYGATSKFSASGLFLFGSYRDPNIEKTLQVYDELPDYVAQLNLSKEDLTRLTIGTIAGLDQPLRPQAKASTAVTYYLLTNKPSEWRQKERNAVLSMNNEKLQSWGPEFKKALRESDYVVSGNKIRIEKSKSLFNNIIDLTN